MRHARPILTAAIFLAIAAPASATTVRFTLPAQGAHAQVIARHAPSLELRYVLVNGQSLLYGDYGGPDKRQAFMYGNGIVLRFYQRGNTQYVRAASTAPKRRRVLISFTVSR